MNHKRGKPKQARAGCLLCKPHKMTSLVKADRASHRRQAFELERVAVEGGVVRDHRATETRYA